MKELFPKDIFSEQAEATIKSSRNKGYRPWVTIAVLIMIGSIFIWNQIQIANTIKPGIAHYSQGNYAAAEADLHKYTHDALTTDEPNGHYYLGLCLLHEGKFADARPEIQWVREHAGHKDLGLNNWATKMLKSIDELPANPMPAQVQQWQLKHLTQHHGH